jgi:cytidine deaminase
MEHGDEEYVAIARAVLASTPRPHCSNFLVAAVLVAEDSLGGVHHVVGVNAEVCSIAGSLCAERSAILQLRLRPGAPHRLTAVYITATADAVVTPGLLCREFLSEFGQPDMRVVMWTPEWRAGGGGRMVVQRLGELWPHPSPLRGVPRADLMTRAGELAASQAQPSVEALASVLGPLAEWAPTVLSLYAAVVETACKPGPQDSLYPVHYAAGVLLSDGTTVVARTDVGLEYGTTVDGVVKLAHAITQAAAPCLCATPLLLLHATQAGTLSAPFAAPRAWLSEYGHGGTAVLLHDAGGQLVLVPASVLAPALPAISL